MDTPKLNLPEELILMLLNEQTGYFHQVSGWTLNCAVIGAVLADLSLEMRIDTDRRSLHLLDSTKTGNPSLDICLKAIADETEKRSTRYWIERLAIYADDIIDSTLDRLVELKILQYHDGDFWTLAPVNWHTDGSGGNDDTAKQFVRSRISNNIFTDTIPLPRDIIIISLVNTCDLFGFMFEIDEDTKNRIEQICQMELIGRVISDAIQETIANPLLRKSHLTKKIPFASLFKIGLNRNFWKGNLPALFADLAEEYGSVFRIRRLFGKPMTFMVGAEINRWVHRKGRKYLTSRNFYLDIQGEYGGAGLLPTLDGADHFKLRKVMQPPYSGKRLESELDTFFSLTRNNLKTWKTGSQIQPYIASRLLVNSQLMPIAMSTDTNDIFPEVVEWKDRILTVHFMLRLPKFLARIALGTPAMKRGLKAVDTTVKRIQQSHTPAQRVGCPRDLGDETLGLLASDPQFMPEANLRFMLSAPMLGSLYLGDLLGCAIYAMVTQPEIYAKIKSEADALFANGDPKKEDLTDSAIEVTNRFVMECQRMYPVVHMIPRNVANSCVVEGVELPVGELVFIAHCASHFLEDVFPEPHKFDIDRYLPPRDEHRSPGFAPYGLGTHTCLGMHFMKLQLTLNILMIAHYFKLELSNPNFKFKFNAFPSLSVSKKLKFHVVEQFHDLSESARNSNSEEKNQDEMAGNFGSEPLETTRDHSEESLVK